MVRPLTVQRELGRRHAIFQQLDQLLIFLIGTELLVWLAFSRRWLSHDRRVHVDEELVVGAGLHLRSDCLLSPASHWQRGDVFNMHCRRFVFVFCLCVVRTRRQLEVGVLAGGCVFAGFYRVHLFWSLGCCVLDGGKDSAVSWDLRGSLVGAHACLRRLILILSKWLTQSAHSMSTSSHYYIWL